MKLDLLLHGILDLGETGTDEAGKLIRSKYPSLSDVESKEIVLLLQSAMEKKKGEKVTLVATAPTSFSIKARPTKVTVDSMIRSASASIIRWSRIIARFCVIS